jgi:indolepyruvate ferredoxin oxidoreductase, beta subunit
LVAGLGGQGVLKASDIIAGAAFLAGLDVKKSEVHGMSQRGGSVASDVRFGARVFSPMVSARRGGFPAGPGRRADRSQPRHARPAAC